MTKQGISRPEIVAPDRQRFYSLAVTAEETDGRPSSWSAAVDSAAFGAEERGEPKRLIIVSAGNVPIFDIDVFPAKGWWAARSFKTGPWHKCHRRSLRYSLIVSVEIEADVPLYTAIRTELDIPLDVEVTA